MIEPDDEDLPWEDDEDDEDDEDEEPGPDDDEGPLPWEGDAPMPPGVGEDEGLTPEERAAYLKEYVDQTYMLMRHLSSFIRDARVGPSSARIVFATFDDGEPLAGTDVEPERRIRPDQVDPYEAPTDEPDPSDPGWPGRLQLYGPDGVIPRACHRMIARAIAPAYPFRDGDIVDFDDGRRVWRCKISDVDYRTLTAEITRDRRALRCRVPFGALTFIRRSTRRVLLSWQTSQAPRRRWGQVARDGKELAPPGP